MDTGQANKISPKDMLKFLIRERDETTKLRDEMNRHYLELRIDNIKEKRDFFKHLTVLSGIILGLSAYIRGELLGSPYYLIGVAFHVLVIISVLLYTRETLDKDQIGLVADQDRYGGLCGDKLKLIDEYIDGGFKEDIFENYNRGLHSLPSVKALKEANLRLDEQMVNRHKEPLDFSGEFILFLFMTGTLFILFPIIQYKPNVFLLSSSILLIFGFTFTDSWLWLIKYISRFAKLLRCKL